jgi:anion-transporting  ArsA/GET3 family ATPase
VSVAERLEGRRVCIVAGSGGVGKTTTSAALAMGLAARGQRVAVVTIDPARRLADALGLEELGNEPRLVDPARFAGHGIEIEGELWAMMLDAKRTFDELIGLLAPDERARDEILANRIYQELSAAVAGSQEFSAIAKLYELHRSGRFDVVILDTPPSRNALDFLDAPDRLTAFFQGRALRLFLAPTGPRGARHGPRHGRRLRGPQARHGVDLLQDLSVFFRSLGGVVDGFAERAAGVKALLATRPRRSSSSPRPSASRSTRRSSSAASCARRRCRSAASSSTASIPAWARPSPRPRRDGGRARRARSGPRLRARSRRPWRTRRCWPSATSPPSAACAPSSTSATRSWSRTSTATSTTWTASS